ncbi:alpha/beta hydrolase [Candidatus Laterigemmans baculatus]|uniref:alpha/beta hydrolase n=1 Tax=Candidatus Laterigemmans baculatus TaxID=2770505 RepID=UPI0013DD42FF|nr:alpha/beta hydrolase [Candidatus Laterigemmans baculatus]
MPVRPPLPTPAIFLASLLCGLLCSLPLTGSAAAAEPVRMPLWPDQAPGQSGAPGARGTEAGDRPELVLYRASRSKADGLRAAAPTAAVVIIPGGGYGHLASDHEGTQIAEWFNSMGVTAGICMYRHRRSGAGYGHPTPLLDAQRAVRTMRAHAADWGIDPDRVGIIGFSAGGHLASSVSTTKGIESDTAEAPIDRHSSRPDFAILCYPVISFGQDHTHVGSQRNLLGEEATAEQLAELSTENRVTADTPPTFLFHTTADKVVPVKNSLVYYQALVDHGVPAELHVFEHGQHGVGLAAGIEGTGAWPELCKTWLQGHGFVAK